MNVLSLFDGKSSGYTAMELAGVPVTNYYSSEVDKYAIQVSNAIHPNQTRLGDITKWHEWNIDWASIDLVMAGSPCQGFSFAGKQLAFDDPRSKLFFVFVDILNHIKSVNHDVLFLLENVKMKKEFMQVIDEQLGVESILINSALVSAQNRQRLYWSNIPIDQPDDKSLTWEDIAEYDVDKKYYLSDKLLAGFAAKRERRKEMKSGFDRLNVLAPKAKVSCITARYHKTSMSDPFIDQGGIRRLTPSECFKCQTVPAQYISKILNCGVSNTQLYRVAGNGWTDEVIAHIFTGIKDI